MLSARGAPTLLSEIVNRVPWVPFRVHDRLSARRIPSSPLSGSVRILRRRWEALECVSNARFSRARYIYCP